MQCNESDISPVTGQFSINWLIIDWAELFDVWVTESSELTAGDWWSLSPAECDWRAASLWCWVWVWLQHSSGRRAERERRDPTSYRERAEARRARPDSARQHQPGCGQQRPGGSNTSDRARERAGRGLTPHRSLSLSLGTKLVQHDLLGEQSSRLLPTQYSTGQKQQSRIETELIW